MPDWSREEDEILKEHYSNSLKEGLLELLPKHSWDAIKVRANHNFGLRRNKEVVTRAKGLNPWTEEEIEILKKVYPTRYTEEIMKALPNHTWSSIETQAMDLKIHRKLDRRFGSIKPVKLSEGDLGYIAAMIDGEGSICITKCKKGLVSTLSISNNDRDMLSWIQSVLGRGHIYKHTKRGNLCFQIARNSDQIALLEVLMPYLKVKRRQAELALKFLRARRKSRRVPVYKNGRARGTRVIHHPDEKKAYEEYVAYVESKRLN